MKPSSAQGLGKVSRTCSIFIGLYILLPLDFSAVHLVDCTQDCNRRADVAPLFLMFSFLEKFQFDLEHFIQMFLLWLRLL